MKRILIVGLSILAIVVGTSLMSPAAPKNDGRPDGGTLGYGEYGRPSTLDPITSNEMISLRITELVFNGLDRKSTRLNSSHLVISYAVFCLKKKNIHNLLPIAYPAFV